MEQKKFDFSFIVLINPPFVSEDEQDKLNDEKEHVKVEKFYSHTSYHINGG